MIPRNQHLPTHAGYSGSDKQIEQLARKTSAKKNKILRLDGDRFKTGDKYSVAHAFLRTVYKPLKFVPLIGKGIEKGLKQINSINDEQRNSATRRVRDMVSGSDLDKSAKPLSARKVVTLQEAVSFLKDPASSKKCAPESTWIYPPTMAEVNPFYTKEYKAHEFRDTDNMRKLMRLDYRVEQDPAVVQTKHQSQVEAAKKQQEAEELQEGTMPSTVGMAQREKTHAKALFEGSLKFKKFTEENEIQISKGASKPTTKITAPEESAVGEPEAKEPVKHTEPKGTIKLEPRIGYESSVKYKTIDEHTGMATCQGPNKRMEDAHLFTTIDVETKSGIQQVKISGVFDGHGGVEASAHVSSNLAGYLKARLEENQPDTLDDVTVYNALKLAFVDAGNSFIPSAANPTIGTTANVMMEVNGDLWAANSGDSRSFLIKPDGTSIQMTEDAKPTDKKFADRIKARGGDVILNKANGIARTAGGVGDHFSYGTIPVRPQISKFPKPKEGWAGFSYVQACDGLYDITNCRTAGNFVHARMKAGDSDAAITGQLVEFAYNAGSDDNISVVHRRMS